MVVVDSSVWIDHFRGTPSPEREVLRALLSRPESGVVMPDLVLFEVLRGFRAERDLRLAREALSVLPVENIGGEAHALLAADRWRRLRALGWTVRSSVDALVASFCLERDLVLLHRDRDYDAYVQHFGLRSWARLAQLN